MATLACVCASWLCCCRAPSIHYAEGASSLQSLLCFVPIFINFNQVAVRCLRESALLEPDAPCTIANLASALWTNLTVPLQQEMDDQSGTGNAAAAASSKSGKKKENKKKDDDDAPRIQLSNGAGHSSSTNGAQLPKIPYNTPRARVLADEMALVLRHATEVLPVDWAHVDTIWTRLAVVHLDTQKPNLAVRALLDGLTAAHATLEKGASSSDDEEEDSVTDRQTSSLSDASSNKKSPLPQRIFRSSVTGRDESSGAPTFGLTIAGGSTNFSPSWWHHTVHLLGDALVAAKENGGGPLDHAKASDRLFAGLPGGCAEHPSRVLSLAATYLPQDPLLWAELGRAWLRLGLVDEGAAQLQASLNLGDRMFGTSASWPGRASVLHGLGSAAGMNSDVEGAIGHFQAALQAEPRSPNSAATRFLLARSLAERGDEVAALDQLDEAVNLGLWVSEALLKGSAFDDLRNHPRFLSIKERMAKNSPSQ